MPLCADDGVCSLWCSSLHLALGVTMAVGIHNLTTQKGAHEPLAVRSFNIKEWTMPATTLPIRWSLFLCGESYGFAKGKCGNLDRDVSFFLNGDGIDNNVGYLDYGFEQTWDMELEQSTLSGRVNRGGHEQAEDVLYPFNCLQTFSPQPWRPGVIEPCPLWAQASSRCSLGAGLRGEWSRFRCCT
ncbi:hypothetical protein CPB85DRAFT_204956 [Mucidula mucida]|nr:hypothetical protein CPB85DRAFT_204956 [Mucidula mucida]